MERQKFLKKDLIIILSVFLVGVILFVVFLITRAPGSSVVVSYDGAEIATYSLDDDMDVMIYMSGDRPVITEYENITDIRDYNRLVIKDGRARMVEADCPDRLCVGQGEISEKGDSVICLPHRLSIRITGEGDGAPEVIR